MTPTAADVSHSAVCDHDLLRKVKDLEVVYEGTWQLENIDERIQISITALDALEPSAVPHEQLAIASSEELTNETGTQKRTIAFRLIEATHSFDVQLDWKRLPAFARNVLLTSNRTVDIVASMMPAPSKRKPDHREDIWPQLSCAFYDRFEHTQDMEDLELKLAWATCTLISFQAPHIPALIDISSALHARYLLSGHDSDLISAIAILDHPWDPASEAHSTFPVLRFQLGCARMLHYQKHGDPSELDVSRGLLSYAFQNTDVTHPKRGRIAQNLAVAHILRYELDGKSKDLEEHSRLMNESVRLSPSGHPFRAKALHGLGMAFSYRYITTGDLDHLSRALELYQTALHSLTSQQSNFRARILNGICVQFGHRFDRTGSRADLDDSIQVSQQVLALSPRAMQPYINLGRQLLIRYRLDSNIEDLESTVKLHRHAAQSCHPGHTSRYEAFWYLASSLLERFRQTSDCADLEEAITLYREIIDNEAPGAPNQDDNQHSLVMALIMRYMHLSTLNDLQEASTYYTDWLKQRADTNSLANPTKPWLYLYNAAKVFILRFDHFHDTLDLYTAIQLLEEALQVQSEEDPVRHDVLTALATAYRKRAESIDSSEDAQKSFTLQTTAIARTVNNHFDRARIQLGIAELYNCPAFLGRDVRIALDFYYNAITTNSYPAPMRLSEGLPVLGVLKNGVSYEPPNEDLQTRLIQAYRATVHLFPQIAYFGLDIQARLSALSRAPFLAAEAAAYALQVHKPEVALEILEEGRAVFWMQYSRLRSSFSQLPSDLADKLRKVAQELEVGARQWAAPCRTDVDEVSLREEQAVQRRRLSEMFEHLLGEARSHPGLERFMLNKTFSTLAMAAQAAPVVVLVATPDYCGAVLLRDSDSSPEELRFHIDSEYLDQISKEIHCTGQITRGLSLSRAVIKRTMRRRGSLGVALGDLWRKIMTVMVKTLGYQRTTGRSRPRLILCATGSFTHVPLHAAHSQMEGCWSYFIPSYTPTLGALLNARQTFTPVRRCEAKVFLATVRRAFKWAPLVQTVAEAECLEEAVPSGLATSVVGRSGKGSDSASATDVLENLPSASILHLACHGYYDAANPLHSGFVMRDKMLTVTQLMELNLSHAFFAFLSACDTAKTSTQQPDQAVNLATTMLFVGFKSVIGTMWSMGDVDGPVVAKHVYKELFAGDDEFLDPSSIPYALDAALQELRDRKVQAYRWAPYVHFGI